MGWVQRSSSGNADYIFGAMDTASDTRQLALSFDSSDNLRITQRNNDTADNVTGDTAITDTDWHHVAVTSSGTAWILYLDGEAESLTVATGANTGDWFADTAGVDNAVIGAFCGSTCPSNLFAGGLMHIKVYSRAVTAAEVLADYNRGR
jgi:hypothetical protein